VLAGPVWAGWWSAAGRPVGDQPGDGQVGLGVVLPPPDPALQRPPLLVLGVGVLDADPLGGLLLAGLLPGFKLLGWRVLGWLGWRRVDPTANALARPR
jgi:hypothetical protein